MQLVFIAVFCWSPRIDYANIDMGRTYSEIEWEKIKSIQSDTQAV